MACLKTGDRNDKYARDRHTETIYLEEKFDVIVREEADGGSSHSYAKHSTTVTREYLNGRLEKEKKTVVTQFVTERIHRECRAKWLAAFAPQMHDHDRKYFTRTLNMNALVGHGYSQAGETWNVSHVTFSYSRNHEGRWAEITGYPHHAPKSVHGSWGSSE